MSFAAAQYRAARVGTATPAQIVVQLYDAAIRFMAQALTAMESGDAATRSDRLRRSHSVVSELQASLIHSHAPELCSDLDRLYDFVLHSITQATITGERTKLEGSIRVMRELRGAWAELAK